MTSLAAIWGPIFSLLFIKAKSASPSIIQTASC